MGLAPAMQPVIVAMGASAQVDGPGSGQTQASGYLCGVLLNPPSDGSGVQVDLYDGTSTGGRRIASYRLGDGYSTGGFMGPFPIPYTTGLFANVIGLGSPATAGEAIVYYQQGPRK